VLRLDEIWAVNLSYNKTVKSFSTKKKPTENKKRDKNENSGKGSLKKKIAARERDTGRLNWMLPSDNSN
jgi:hypothetical protein